MNSYKRWISLDVEMADLQKKIEMGKWNKYEVLIGMTDLH